VVIRRGELRDLPAIAAIQAASPEAAAWPAADYLAYELLVAVRDGHVAGFLSGRRVDAEEREILNVAVAPEIRRIGVGRALVAAFLDGNGGDVFLEVRASNQTAQRFYKCLGFQEFTLRPGYYSDPDEAAIVMKFHSC
jgi:ribosomal-protein-alanine N-acetyltransferase